MANIMPINVQEVASLCQLGVDSDTINLTSVSMTSERSICVRETSQVILINLEKKQSSRRPIMSCEATLMHPQKNILALRGTNKMMQIVDLDTKLKIAEHQGHADIAIWHWISENVIAFATETEIYHWSINSGVKKAFDIATGLQSCCLIRYCGICDDVMKWSAVVGLYNRGGHVQGRIQLFSGKKQMSQCIEAFAIAVSSCMMDDHPAALLCFATWSITNLHGNISVVKNRINQSNGQIINVKKSMDINFTNVTSDDFPVSLEIDQKLNMAFLLTKHGLMNLYHIDSLVSLHTMQISGSSIFLTCRIITKNGILVINRSGQVIEVTLNKSNIVHYLKGIPGLDQLAMHIALENDLPGAEDLFINKFNVLIAGKNYLEAAKLAATAPKSVLRTNATLKTLELFDRAQDIQQSAVYNYFQTIINLPGSLNKFEAVGLVKILKDRQETGKLINYLKLNKIECSEELGDAVVDFDLAPALSIYLRASAHGKVVQCFTDLGEFDKIKMYMQQIGYSPDFKYLLRRLLLRNKSIGVNFSEFVARESFLEVNKIVDILMEGNLFQESTALLLKVLSDNRPEDGDLHTRLLEINLTKAPHVADAILLNRKYTFFDRSKIARLCENSGLYKRALELYTDLYDIKRIMKFSADINDDDWIILYIGNLSAEDTLECLKDMLELNTRANLNLCLKIATTYSAQLPVRGVIDLFESVKCYDGLLSFLTSIIPKINDETIHFKYIETTLKTGHYNLLDKFCRESTGYNPEKVKNYLKGQNLSDQRPLLIVCDRFDMIPDLVSYLYKNDMFKSIEVLVQNLNTHRLPSVIAALIDLNCNDMSIKNLIFSVDGEFPIDELSNVLESRGKLKLMLPWFEMKSEQGSTDKGVHNSLAKILIDCGNRNTVEKFLRGNIFYDKDLLGKYCEKRAPDLACIIYELGGFDEKFLMVCFENGYFKQAASHIFNQKDLDLWKMVLNDDKYKQSIVDQILQSAAKEKLDASNVSVTIKAFLASNLNLELILFLEEIIINNATFNEQSLQNLLMLTAIKSEPGRVMDLATRLDNYDADEVAKFAIDRKLYDETVVILTNAGLHDRAISVLLDNLDDFNRAVTLAEKCQTTRVWSLLGSYQLKRGFIEEGVASFLKANDTSQYVAVVDAVKSIDGYWRELVEYLEYVRIHVRDPFIEDELLYGYAKTNELEKLEALCRDSSTLINATTIAERCFHSSDATLLPASLILYTCGNDFAGVVQVLLRLGDVKGAVAAARKANSLTVWMRVCVACVAAGEFAAANAAAVHVISCTDYYDVIVAEYLNNMRFEDLIEVIETRIEMDGEAAHSVIFTELAGLYAKHKPDRLRALLERSWPRLCIPRVIQVALKNHLWSEVYYLYEKNHEYDNAIRIAVDHPTEAWEHLSFKKILQKVVKTKEIYPQCIYLYVTYQPLLLNDLLITIDPRFDRKKIIELINCYLREPSIIRPYLESIQADNNYIVNETLNTLLIQHEDISRLWQSIREFDNFDDCRLAKLLSEHEILEFRKIAAFLYERRSQWLKALDIYKENNLFMDAIKCVGKSENREAAEELTQFFASELFYKRHPEYFAACLCQLYHLLRPDVVLEIAWRENVWNIAAPYFIQVIREFSTDLENLKAEVKRLTEACGESSQIADNKKPLMIDWQQQ